jgi:hypothetical protein
VTATGGVAGGDGSRFGGPHRALSHRQAAARARSLARMIKPVELVLGTAVLNLVFATLAVAQELPVPGDAVATSLQAAQASSWPWIAVMGLVVTLGAIALVSRRRMPFGKSS